MRDAQVTGSGTCAPPRPRPQIAGACGDSDSLTSSTTTILPTCCALCPPSSAESGQIAALKHLRSRLALLTVTPAPRNPGPAPRRASD